ncbi:hypothetical protein CHLNCDRAFT_136131 [Chlorella variabilis]|uniref:MYND-type domain-containing protein n=1 Tax=Chlorella variabilis TaxID=554065 RepID=E1ZJU1_CHLVA|nr:hypothetical protein CHLNCDRAFT_136131 [Chlorella variabilis]EFN54052.1 hypothetical protein CHLNCDRAFT_136131 [Chlorella variabilis]|eukprot:XP_005846154.1 hypothetical protein CHLNCDRAFT_136131 [Chlorella variabilis]
MAEDGAAPEAKEPTTRRTYTREELLALQHAPKCRGLPTGLDSDDLSDLQESCFFDKSPTLDGPPIYLGPQRGPAGPRAPFGAAARRPAVPAGPIHSRLIDEDERSYQRTNSGQLAGAFGSPTKPQAIQRGTSVRAAIAAAGGIPALVQRLRSSSSDAVLEQVAAALGSLGEDMPANKDAIAAAGCIPDLVQHLRSSASEMVQYKVAALLHSLANGSPSSSAAIAAAGGILVLQQLHSSSPNTDVQSVAAAALQNLSNCGQLVTEAASHIAAADAAPAPGATAVVAADATATAAPKASAAGARVCAAEGCGNTHSLRKCSRCRSVRYCSETCSHAHWRAHKAECKHLSAAAAQSFGP